MIPTSVSYLSLLLMLPLFLQIMSFLVFVMLCDFLEKDGHFVLTSRNGRE